MGIAAMAAVAASSVASGSVLFVENFSGPSLVSGLTAVNSPVISGGVATLNGLNAAGTASGFQYVVPSFPSNYIMEARIASYSGSPTQFDAILNAVGNENLRSKAGSPTSLEIVVSDDVTEAPPSLVVGTDSMLTPGTNVALVLTSTYAAFYLNGVYVGRTGDITIANAPTANVLAWGMDVHTAGRPSGTPSGTAGQWRGFNGSFDAIALSTFEGDATTLPATAFALVSVPEPSVMGLLALPVVMLRRSRR